MSERHATDARGLELSGIDADGAAQYDGFINDSYYYRLGVQDRLDRFLLERPAFAMGRVLKGYALMSEGVTASHAKASACLQTAQSLESNPRERLHQEALGAWIAQDWRGCAFAWERILADWPLDLLAFRQHTGTLFWLGDKRYQAQVAASAASHWHAGIAGYPHFLSAYAFAMEEIGHYDEAERAARGALDAQPQDLWALHALAHVLEMQGRRKEGVALLVDAQSFLNDYNLFRGHLWWHLAIFRFSAGEFDEVLALFDREIYPKSSAFFLDLQNAVSLLVRLEAQGIRVGEERWARVAEGSLPTVTQNTIWFTTVHQAYALQRAGNSPAARDAVAHALAQGDAGSERARVAARISDAAILLLSGEPQRGLDGLLKWRQDFGLLGSSHVQQDIYQQLMISTALQLGDWPRVRQLLKERRVVRFWNPASLEQFNPLAKQFDQFDAPEQVRAELRN